MYTDVAAVDVYSQVMSIYIDEYPALDLALLSANFDGASISHK